MGHLRIALAISLSLAAARGAPARADDTDAASAAAPDRALAPVRQWTLPVQIEQLELLPGGEQAIAAIEVHSIDIWKVLVRNWIEIGAGFLAIGGATALLIAIRAWRRPRGPHCRRCRYLLVAVAGDRCPECGRPLRRRDRSPGRRVRIAAAFLSAPLLAASGALLAARGSLPRHVIAEQWLCWESTALLQARFQAHWLRSALRRAAHGRSIESRRPSIVRIDLERGRIIRTLAGGRSLDVLVHPDGTSFFILRWDCLEHRRASDGALLSRIDRRSQGNSDAWERLGLDPDRRVLQVHRGMRVEEWRYEEGRLVTVLDALPMDWYGFFRPRTRQYELRASYRREMPCLVPGRPILLTRNDRPGEEGFEYVAWDLGETATPRPLPLTAHGWSPGFSSDGCWLVDFVQGAAGDTPLSIRVWDLDTGDVSRDVPAPPDMPAGGPTRPSIDSSARYVFAMSVPQPKTAAWYLVDLDRGRCIGLHTAPHMCLPYFASRPGGGTRLVTLGEAGIISSTIRLWDLP